jgi:SpoVK/Ycf46/Vps4 family AAA+-type ATPase
LIKDLENLSKKLNYDLKEWNFGDNPKPLEFLKKIDKDENPTLYIMRDLNLFFKEDGVGLSIMSNLKNLKNKLKNKKKIIIVISSILKIHDSIKRDFLILDDPLPNYDSIKSEVDKFLQRNNLGHNLSESLKDRIVLSSLGLTIDQVNKIFAKTIHKNKKLDEKCLNQIIAEKKLVIGQSNVLDFYDVSETINNVGGLNQLKNWLRIRSKAFSQNAKDYGLPQPKGLLMLGVQGTGKSLTAKAVSSLWRLPLLKLDIGRVFGSLVGESESRIREAINVAETISPCILWIDEIDKAFAGMGGQQGDSGTSARVFGTLITWMQEKIKPVFIVATANDISKLPAEMLRKGRFDEIFFVDIPNEYEREEIFKIHIGKTKRDVQLFDLLSLVEISKGFTGAEIEQSIKDAMYVAFADNEREYNTEDILESLQNTVPLSQMKSEQIEKLRSWAKTSARMASYADTKKMRELPSQENEIIY